MPSVDDSAPKRAAVPIHNRCFEPKRQKETSKIQANAGKAFLDKDLDKAALRGTGAAVNFPDTPGLKRGRLRYSAPSGTRQDRHMYELGGKTVIVTGASEGIGRALSLALADRGARLSLAARNEDRLADVAGACRDLGADVATIATDVAYPHQCRRLVYETVARFGGLYVLLNTAGITMGARADAVDDLSVFRRLMDVNYLGCVYTTLAALEHLKRSGGLIVPVASVAGLTGVPERTGYAASKHAVFGFFDSLRIELAGSGVDVTMIAPDFVLSEIHRRAMDGQGQALGTSPMQESRIMTAEQCAALICRAMEKRQRLLITSLRGRLGRWVRLIAPGLIDRIAMKAIASGR